MTIVSFEMVDEEVDQYLNLVSADMETVDEYLRAFVQFVQGCGFSYITDIHAISNDGQVFTTGYY